MQAIWLIYSTVLTALAGFHLVWALGIWLPIRDEARLVRTVVGVAGAERMPGAIPCALVTVALLFAAVLPWWAESGHRTFLLTAAAAVFGIRGALAYVPWWRRMTPQEPFARLDRALYGPLCLCLGAVAAVTVAL